jgi:predicted Zn-dependent protease
MARTLLDPEGIRTNMIEERLQHCSCGQSNDTLGGKGSQQRRRCGIEDDDRAATGHINGRSKRMAMDKIAGLKEILVQDSKNAFARYGLAMEYSGRGEIEAALAEFAQLLKDNPDYTPGYFMAAQTLAKAGRVADAKQKLVDGLACAKRTGNQHAASEMQAMLDEMEMPE